MNTTSRRVIKFIFTPPVVPEGKGVMVTRIIGNKYLKEMNPFILLDHAVSKLPAGFPDHPHRGFETVSYLLEGSFYHEDSKGNKGILNAGDI
jgi:redox-sensitive bicupin YhaK (pirin superfamily)